MTPTKNGERRAVFNGSTGLLTTLECHITTLKPGEVSSAPHNHPGVEEVTVLREGTVEIQINDTKQIIGPGSVFYFAPEAMSAIKNIGTTPATYTVISIRPPK